MSSWCPFFRIMSVLENLDPLLPIPLTLYHEHTDRRDWSEHDGRSCYLRLPLLPFLMLCLLSFSPFSWGWGAKKCKNRSLSTKPFAEREFHSCDGRDLSSRPWCLQEPVCSRQLLVACCAVS